MIVAPSAVAEWGMASATSGGTGVNAIVFEMNPPPAAALTMAVPGSAGDNSSVVAVPLASGVTVTDVFPLPGNLPAVVVNVMGRIAVGTSASIDALTVVSVTPSARMDSGTSSVRTAPRDVG